MTLVTLVVSSQDGDENLEGLCYEDAVDVPGCVFV